PRHRDPLSFPTRRSSDLAKGSTWVEAVISLACNNRPRASVPTPMGRWMDWFQSTMEVVQTLGLGSRIERDVVMMIHTERLALPRSEEHTSALQSRENLVC